MRHTRMRITVLLEATTILALLFCAACGDGNVADSILTGGLIWSGPASVVSGEDAPTAVAVKDGKILEVGSDSRVEQMAGPRTERIELDGRRVVPGFMDAHTHFIDGGFALASVQLRDAATPAEFSQRIGEYAAAHSGEWVMGGTWDHELWGGELPRRDWIDSLTPGTPVFVTRLDGHMSLANSKALELAGIGSATQDPPGGTIVRYSDGRPTGVLKDEAQGLVGRVIPERTEAELDRALQAAAAHAVERGVTYVADMGSWAGLETYRRARAADGLPLRVFAVVPLSTRARLIEYVEDHGRGDHRLFWGGLKAFVDGSLGSTTAWFYDPYTDEPNTAGLMVTDTTELRRSILEGDEAGMQLIVHAIGDQANDWLLDVFAECRATHGDDGRIFRIEHAQHLSRSAIARFGAEGVVPSMQPYHAIDDGRWAEKRIGPDRIKTTYAFRDLLDADARVAFGSDWTVAPIDPLLGIYAGVTRQTIDGANPSGWIPEQKVSVVEAVTAYTATNAYAIGLADVLGTLEPGKYADLVVLSDDILTIDPVAIPDATVDMTMVEGEVVYQRQ